jgi:hypothetical protein
MQFIFDNIIAVLVASAVLLILAVNLQAGQKESMDATAFHGLNRQVASLTEVVLNDVRSLSRVVSVGEVDNSFKFYSRVSAGGTTEHLVEYRRTLGEIHDGVQIYHIERLVDGQRDGGAAFELVEWQIEFLDNVGVPTSDPAEVVSIRIVLDTTTTITRSAATSQSDFVDSRWEAIIHPPILNPLF